MRLARRVRDVQNDIILKMLYYEICYILVTRCLIKVSVRFEKKKMDQIKYRYISSVVKAINGFSRKTLFRFIKNATLSGITG